ncbi:hypothetical protein DD509_07220 [Dehalogenimonas alkenigignens]|nr:hypothetical protein DD509_07220 [Dehalogenimonas alkenigignens]
MNTAFVPKSDDFRFTRSAHRGILESFPLNVLFSLMNKYQSPVPDARRLGSEPCRTADCDILKHYGFTVTYEV